MSVALLSEIWVRAMTQKPVEEVGFIDHPREENGTVVGWGIHGPAVLEEKFEEGDLLVQGCIKDIVRGEAEDGSANGEEVACNVDIANVKGDNEAVMEEGACAGWGWGLGVDEGLDCGEGAVLAGVFEGGKERVFSVYGVVFARVEREVIVGGAHHTRLRLHGLLQRGLGRSAVAITSGVLRAGTHHCLVLLMSTSKCHPPQPEVNTVAPASRRVQLVGQRVLHLGGVIWVSLRGSELYLFERC